MKNKTMAATQTAQSNNNGAAKEINAYPAPKQLATPTGLDPKDVKKSLPLSIR
jgi:hypothetical protein